ncbi:MAG: D-lactate dehydrogenase [Sphingomicrobium sp.]
MVSAASDKLVGHLRALVGRRFVVTAAGRAAAYAQGYRTGGGPVALVVRPGSLVELWRVFKACIAADHIVIAQAANTSLTGGSTPNGVYDRPVVIINTLRIRGVFPIRGGAQVICLAGSTLNDLERVLSPLGREPHSVIGSSCIGASVIGGVCNNSGGALVQRGPAYTEYALFAHVDAYGEVHLVNHLGLKLGDDAEAALRRLEEKRFSEDDIADDGHAASAAVDYADIVRAIDEPSPARFNADPRRLFEASGSAGKVLVFAVRLDTFARPDHAATFYIGTNDTAELTELRRRFLSGARSLPVSGEYIHREAFDVAARYGKDTVLAIRTLGTERLPWLFWIKDRIDRLAAATRLLPRQPSDRLLQFCAKLLPQHLPSRMRDFRDRYEHHLILKVADRGVGEARSLLDAMFPSASGAAFECERGEAQQAMLHRFAVAGGAVRYRAIHPKRVGAIVAIDVALPRNEGDWFEKLPQDIEAQLVGKLYYGHFFCHVFHQDYLVRTGVDPVALEHRILQLLDARGAEYPAEHNVGHLYLAKPVLADHYCRLDPANCLNPGIGGMDRSRHYGAQAEGSRAPVASIQPSS